MKKVLSLVLCLMLAMSLIAMASAENVVVEAVPNEGQFEGQELSILVSADWMADRYDATIERFEETYGVTVDVQTLPADQYENVLASNLDNGTCPDVFWIQSNPAGAIESKIVDPENRCIDFTGADWQNVMPESRQSACISGGKLYGLQIWHNSPEYVSSRTSARRSPNRASPPGSCPARTAGSTSWPSSRSAACMRRRSPACTTR